MKYILFAIIVAAGLYLGLLIYLSISSRFVENSGLVDGKLSRCPDTPNCVCSESYDNQNYQPLKIQLKDLHLEWDYIKAAITEAGGEIRDESDYYLHATFVTPLFRFVDDFEARIDTLQSCIHLRSASRVGDYDFGTNLKRVNHVVEIYKTKKSLTDSITF